MASRMAARSTIAGTPGEVLHQHAGGAVCDLLGGLVLRRPLRDGLGALVLSVPEQVLEQNLQRVGQARDVVLVLEGVEPEDLVRLAADVERRAGAEGVCVAHLLDVTQRRRAGASGSAGNRSRCGSP